MGKKTRLPAGGNQSSLRGFEQRVDSCGRCAENRGWTGKGVRETTFPGPFTLCAPGPRMARPGWQQGAVSQGAELGGNLGAAQEFLVAPMCPVRGNEESGSL